MNDKKKSFILYHSDMELFKELTDEELGKIIRAIFEYSINGTETEFEARELRIVFNHLKSHIDINKIKYEEKCNKNKANAKARYNKEATTEEKYEVTYEAIEEYITNNNLPIDPVEIYNYLYEHKFRAYGLEPVDYMKMIDIYCDNQLR